MKAYRQIKCVILITMFIINNVFSQVVYSTKNKKAIKFYEESLSLSKIGEFDNAIINFDRSIKSDPEFVLAYIKKAQTLKKKGSYLQSIDTYKKTLQKGLKSNNLDKAYYEIANMYFDLGYYKLSKNFFLKIKDEMIKSRTKKKIENIGFSLEKISDSLKLNVIAFDKVNIFSLQYFPYFDQKNKILYFTARKGRSLFDDEDLYFIEKDNDKAWGRVQPVTSIINSENNEGSITFSFDKNLVVFSFCTSNYRGESCDLYYSKKDQNKWSIPKKLNKKINTEYWESHPSLSSDGKFLFFSSNRPSGFGGKDIWFSKKNGEKWGKAINLGNSINTIGNEISPFIHPNMIDFYFSSNGKKSFGGYDIYHATFNNQEMKGISNFGYPINNHFDQSSFNLSNDGKVLYYTNEEFINESVKNSKIYFAESDHSLINQTSIYFTGQILDKNTNSPLYSNLKITNNLTNESYFIVSDSIDGTFNILLSKEVKYKFSVTSNGYEYNFFELDTLKSQFKKIYLDPISIGLKLDVKNIYFDFDDDQLDVEAKIQLDLLSEWLTNNNSVKIEISGHTDDSGTEKYNMDLSERRAKNVYNYLTEKLDNKNQISYKAYGNKKPIYIGNDENMKKINRRIEFRVIGL